MYTLCIHARAYSTHTCIHSNTVHPLHANGPGHVSSFEGGGSLDKGGHVSSFETGGSIDTRMGGPLSRILIENLEKFFGLAFPNLCHRFKGGLNICFVPLASL